MDFEKFNIGTVDMLDAVKIRSTKTLPLAILDSSIGSVVQSNDSAEISSLTEVSEIQILNVIDEECYRYPVDEGEKVSDEYEFIENSNNVSHENLKKNPGKGKKLPCIKSAKFQVQSSTRKKTLLTGEKVRKYQTKIKNLRQVCNRVRARNDKLQKTAESLKDELESFDQVSDLVPSLKGLLEQEKNEDTYATIILDQVHKPTKFLDL